jgi:hypothetical protein
MRCSMPRCLMILAAVFGLTSCEVDSDGNVTVDADIDEQDFPEVWADAWCDRSYECDQGDFESAWADHDDCVDDKSDDAEFAADWGDLLCGDYDEDAAASCISAMNAGSCEDWTEDDWKNACDNVYGC